MNSLKVVVLLLGSAAASYVAIRLYLRFALDKHVLDVPNERSSHRVPTPRGGGVAFAAVFLISAGVLGATKTLFPQETLAIMTGLSLAVVGYLDDMRNVSIRTRLMIQIVSVCAAVAALTMLHIPGESHSSALLVGCVVLCQAFGLTWMINLTNFMDGIDGITSIEVVTVSAVCAALIMFRHGFTVPALLFVLLGVTVAPFLLFNWMPARMFMGDAGSTFLGFTLGILSMIAVARHELSLFVPVIVFGVFVIDATMTLVTRMLRKERWYLPHNTHAFQILARRFDHKSVSSAVGIVNLVWLAPFAMAAEVDPQHGVLYVVIALAPLAVLSRMVGAGQPESGSAVESTATQTKHSLARIAAFAGHHSSALRLLSIAILSVACVCGALVLHFDGTIPNGIRSSLFVIVAIWSACQCFLLVCFRIHRSEWRFTSMEDFPRLIGTSLLASLVGAVAVKTVLHMQGLILARPVYIFELILSILAFSGLQIFSNFAFRLEGMLLPNSERQSVLICSADAGGVSILSEIRRRFPKYHPVGFIDDRPEVKGMSLSGLRVLGSTSELNGIIKRHGVHHVLINASPLSTETADAMNKKCREENIELRTVPSLADSDAAMQRHPDRQIAPGKWLRGHVGIDCSLIASNLEGRVAMVTGAASLLGSELCRQIAAFRPSAIVGCETSEPGLFFLERELHHQFPSVNFIPCLGGVENWQRLAEVLASSRPDVVYHAAAYKRVGLMEHNICEAIEHNVIATEMLLRACTLHGVTSFVMLSTEEVACPTSLMDATRRAAEMVVMASSSSSLKCASIRVGRIVGSPDITDDVSRGQSWVRPSIVAHSSMQPGSIPVDEAAQLVLQASSFRMRHEVFVLKAEAAARNYSQSGQVFGADVSRTVSAVVSESTRLWPDHKDSGEHTLSTTHSSIHIIQDAMSRSTDVIAVVEQLRIVCERRSAVNALKILMAIVPDYSPRQEVLNAVTSADKISTPSASRVLGSVSGF